MPNEPDLPAPPSSGRPGSWGIPDNSQSARGWGSHETFGATQPPSSALGEARAIDELGPSLTADFSVRPVGKSPRRRRIVLAFATVLIVAAVGGAVLLTRGADEDPGLPSPDTDRVTLTASINRSGESIGLVATPDAVKRIEDLAIVADRGSCDGAPTEPPDERAVATQVFAPSDGGGAPFVLGIGAFAFGSSEAASEFVASVRKNLPVCAVSAAPVSAATVSAATGVDNGVGTTTAGEIESWSYRMTVELASLAGFDVELQMTVARRGRFVAVAAGADGATAAGAAVAVVTASAG